MELNNVSKIIVGFLMVIVGVSLIGTVANNSALVTDKAIIVNETVDISSARISGTQSINITASNFTITNAPTGWKTTDCPITSVTYGNATAQFTSATDYNLYTTSGILQVLNTSTTGEDSITNTTYVSYTYCRDDYLNIAWGRSIIGLVTGFFALAILGIGIALLYSVFRESGIVGKDM